MTYATYFQHFNWLKRLARKTDRQMTDRQKTDYSKTNMAKC